MASPSPAQAWLEAFVAYEREEIHLYDDASCDIPYPLGAPGLVIITEDYPAGAIDVSHTFTYYYTPDAMLKDLFQSIRKVSSCERYVVSYKADTNTFKSVEPVWSVVGYTPALNAYAHRYRKRRFKSIALQHSPVLLQRVDKDDFFACLTRDLEGSTTLVTLETLQEVAGYISHTTVGFEAFYDLRVGDQPVPLRLSASYTDVSGAVYEHSEVL